MHSLAKMSVPAILATIGLGVAAVFVIRAGTSPTLPDAFKRVTPEARQLISQLETGPTQQRRALMDTIRGLACPSPGHPPKRSSSRIDLLPVLERALEDDDPKVQEEASETLAYMNAPEAVPVLLSALQSEETMVRYNAVMGLKWLADEPEHRKKIVTALEVARDDRTQFVRLHAASALLRIGEYQDATVFIETMRDDNGNWAMASLGLAELGRMDTIELIIDRLEIAVPSLDYHCGRALEQLTGESFGKDHEKWLEWLERNRSSLPEQIRKR